MAGSKYVLNSTVLVHYVVHITLLYEGTLSKMFSLL